MDLPNESFQKINGPSIDLNSRAFITRTSTKRTPDLQKQPYNPCRRTQQKALMQNRDHAGIGACTQLPDARSTGTMVPKVHLANAQRGFKGQGSMDTAACSKPHFGKSRRNYVDQRAQARDKSVKK